MGSRLHPFLVVPDIHYSQLENLLYNSSNSDPNSPEYLLDVGIGRVKLADFGLSKQIFDLSTQTPCGTIGYTAPEIVLSTSYGKNVDVWALGCVLFTILCGYPPFHGEVEEVTRNVAVGDWEFTETRM